MRPMAGANGGASRAPAPVGKVALWKTTKHSALRTKFLWESRDEKVCRLLKIEENRQHRRATSAFLGAPKQTKQRAFCPKQRRNPHFIDKRKKAFYNQIIGVPFAKKTNGWDASARNSPRIWTEVCFVLRRCKRHGFCVLYAPGCRAFLGVVMNQHRKPRQCFSLAALAKCAEQNTDRASIFRKKEKPCSERLHKN